MQKKYSVSPKIHFIHTDQRLETPEKKMPLHQNHSPNYNYTLNKIYIYIVAAREVHIR